MVDSFSIWFFPIEVPADTRTIIVGVLLVLSIAWFFRKNLRQILRNGFQQILLMNWGFIFIYSAYLLIVSSLVAFDAIYHRFTAPLYIPFVVSVLVAIAQTKKFNITLKIIGNALIVAWIGYLGYTMIIDIKTSLSEGAGSFASTYWQDMEFPKYIAQNPPDGIVYSNFPDALYLFSNLPASLSPRKHFYRSRNSETGDIEKLQSELDSGNQVFLVWFTEVGRGFLYTPQELGNVLLVEEREKQSDGIVYHLSRKPPGDMP